MKRYPLYLLFGLPAIAAACACATPVAAQQDPPSACKQLATEIDEARARQKAAREAMTEAWKFVVPVAVLANHVQAHNEALAAERELAALQAKYKELGC
jgi:predicted  nucleic acid-binding Zn-ribbon protein